MNCSNWSEYKLQEVCSITDCQHKTAPTVNEKTKYKMLRTSNIRNGKIDSENVNYVTEDTYEKWSVRGYLTIDDVILTREAPMGEVGIIKTNDKFFLGQRLLQLKANTKLITSDFLYYSLLGPFLQKQIRMNEGMGSVVSNIRIPILQNMIIKVPTIEEQLEIVHVLNNINKKIDLNNEMNKTLEAIAQALVKRWFVDFEFPDEEGNPYKSSGGEMVDSEIGMIPKGWKVQKLKECIKFIKGKKPRIIDNYEFEDSKIYLTIDVLNRKSIQYASNEKVILADKNDILMVMDGASSGTLYFGIDGIVGSTLSKLVVMSDCLNSHILYYYLKMNEEYIKNHLTGSAIPHTDKEYINRMNIAVTNNKIVLNSITNILFNIRYKVINNSEENVRLIALRDALLPKIMSGETELYDKRS